MKGLLLKDIYNLRKVSRQYLLILLFFTLYCFFLKNPTFFPMMTILSFSMLILTSLGYDEAVSFDKYALTLPVCREDLVRTKYVMFLLLLGTGSVIGMLGNLTINFLIPDVESLAEQLVSILSVVAVFLIVFSTMLPLVFKMGVEKARMLLMVCYIAIFGVIYLGITLMKKLNLEDILTEPMMIGLAIGGIVLAVLYVFASYCMSVRIIRKREW
ncbi:MAG: ABC-2 transporter permease [Lachnospiraceae bacterium]|jgi:ABC-2 type transport system permease protein|nr:ABC-2 transporter permease [Lachnospiraceae bacterium]